MHSQSLMIVYLQVLELVTIVLWIAVVLIPFSSSFPEVCKPCFDILKPLYY